MLLYAVMLFFGFALALDAAASNATGMFLLGLILMLIALVVDSYRTAERMNQQNLARY